MPQAKFDNTLRVRYKTFCTELHTTFLATETSLKCDNFARIGAKLHKKLFRKFP